MLSFCTLPTCSFIERHLSNPSLLQAYVQIKARAADDMTAKIVHYFLISSLSNALAKHLYASLPDEKLAELLAEDHAVARDRARQTQSLERFKRARDTLKKL